MILSYAQNFEDVILWRALKTLEKGFYIDIGAQDPVVDSVSLAFYEKGWRGVHVEPTPAYAQKLREARPDETVLQVAVGSSASIIPFWEFPDTGLSTGSASIAAGHRDNNFRGVPIQVASIPLSQVLDAQGGQPVHWLKIDVEGMEDEVLASWAPSPVRPWIVVVESTKPLSQDESYSTWEPKLLNLGYEFVYFDGLNRFYVSGEHKELKAAFGSGPNCFDPFQLSHTSIYTRRLNSELEQRSHEIGQLGQAVASEKARADQQANTFAQAVGVWEASAATLTSELHIKNQALAARDERLQDLKKALAAQDQHLQGLQGERQRLLDDLSARDQRLRGLEGVLVQRENETVAALSARDGEIRDLRESLAQGGQAIAERDREIQSLLQILSRREAEIWAANGSLAAMRASTSWRVSAPLRWASRAARSVLRPALELGLGAARRYPALKPALWAAASVAPPFKRKMTAFAQVRTTQPLQPAGVSHPVASAPSADGAAPRMIVSSPVAAPVSLRARQILADLQSR